MPTPVAAQADTPGKQAFYLPKCTGQTSVEGVTPPPSDAPGADRFAFLRKHIIYLPFSFGNKCKGETCTFNQDPEILPAGC